MARPIVRVLDDRDRYQVRLVLRHLDPEVVQHLGLAKFHPALEPVELLDVGAIVDVIRRQLFDIESAVEQVHLEALLSQEGSEQAY